MVSIEDVKLFLEQFSIKTEVFGIIFRNDRPKNRETLLLLDILCSER